VSHARIVRELHEQGGKTNHVATTLRTKNVVARALPNGSGNASAAEDGELKDVGTSTAQHATPIREDNRSTCIGKELHRKKITLNPV